MQLVWYVFSHLCYSVTTLKVPLHFHFVLGSTSSLFLLPRSTGVHLLPLRTISGSASMSTLSTGPEAKVVVVATLVLALLGVMCGPVGGSRFMKPSVSARRANLSLLPPHSPPPPEYVQFPPPVHHHHVPPCTCPPLLLPPAPSARPPTSRPHLPPPLLSPPPPDEERTLHGRRLLSSEHVADPNSSHSGGNEVVTRVDFQSPGNCTETPPAVPYGGGYVPAGAPYPYGPGDLSPAPAPSPVSGADHDTSNSQPALPPLVGDNSTLAHTIMVSAMKFSQCTYTIITTTGNIEGAGTTADVNAEFFNKYGDSVLFVNLKSQNRNFNRGATDTFTLVGDCVQNICKMHLSHDDSGPNPGWFVNTVTVSLMYQTHVFNVFEWLAKDEPPYSLSRTISSCPA